MSKNSSSRGRKNSIVSFFGVLDKVINELDKNKQVSEQTLREMENIISTMDEGVHTVTFKVGKKKLEIIEVQKDFITEDLALRTFIGIQETLNSFILEIGMPGIRLSEVIANVKNDFLIVKIGERYVFQRKITDDLTVDAMAKRSGHGVIEIIIPKKKK